MRFWGGTAFFLLLSIESANKKAAAHHTNLFPANSLLIGLAETT